MSQLLSVRGGRRLEGEVTIQGAKNSVLPILAATLLARGQVALLGCPRLRDVDASIRILRHLGCDAHWEADALAVDPPPCAAVRFRMYSCGRCAPPPFSWGRSWPGAGRRT